MVNGERRFNEAGAWGVESQSPGFQRWRAVTAGPRDERFPFDPESLRLRFLSREDAESAAESLRRANDAQYRVVPFSERFDEASLAGSATYIAAAGPSGFSSDQIEVLRREYGGIEKVTLDRAEELERILDPLPAAALKQLANLNPKINFVSSKAATMLLRRGVKFDPQSGAFDENKILAGSATYSETQAWLAERGRAAQS